jgi:hypothetical protein
MKKMNENQLQNLEGGKFWGSTSSNCVTESSGGGCYTTYCDYTSYAFWIVVERLSHIPSGTSCNNL